MPNIISSTGANVMHLVIEVTLTNVRWFLPL